MMQVEDRVTTPSDFRLMGLDVIGRRCSEETQKFLRQIDNDTRYCFELFRRAYADLLDEALSHIYQIYVPLLVRRARRHPMYFQSCQDEEYFARRALTKFYEVSRGERFDSKFSMLPGIIKYLYACLHSVIVQEVRDNARIVEPASDEENWLSAEPSDMLPANDLWDHIARLLPDSDLQRLAYLRFVLGVKPAEIAELHPQVWSNKREVSVALQTIRRRLRKDQELRDLAGLADDFDDAD